MDAEFQITSEDYVAAGQLNGQMSKKSKKIHYIIDVLLVLSGLLALYFGIHNLAWGLIGGAIGANLIPFILSKLYIPWHLKRHYKKYNLIKKPTVVSLTPTGVNFKSNNGEGLLNWVDIHAWRENDTLILIYIAPKMYYVLPKRVSQSGFSVDELKNKLIEHAGNAS